MGQTLKTITDYACYLKRDLDPPFVRDNAIQAFEDLWRSHPWRFRLVRGQINAVADYSTGYVSALTQAASAVTGFGTTWGPEYVLRHLRPTNNSATADGRDYLVTARGSDTGLTIEDPYEGTTISANTAYTLYKRWYQLPPDFGYLVHMKNSGGPQIVRHMTREEFEGFEDWPNVTGNSYIIVDAGVTKQTLWDTGTVTMTRNSSAVSGSGTSWVEARDKGRRYRVRNFPKYGTFTVSAVGGATSITLDREWKGETKSGLAYEIDPAGEPLVELYPRPTANTSIQIWYYKTLPPLVLDTESPQGLPDEYHDAWLYATLTRLGITDGSVYNEKVGQLMEKQSLMTRETIRSAPFGGGNRSIPSRLGVDYPTYPGNQR